MDKWAFAGVKKCTECYMEVCQRNMRMIWTTLRQGKKEKRQRFWLRLPAAWAAFFLFGSSAAMNPGALNGMDCRAGLDLYLFFFFFLGCWPAGAKKAGKQADCCRGSHCCAYGSHIWASRRLAYLRVGSTGVLVYLTQNLPSHLLLFNGLLWPQEGSWCW